MARVSRRGPQRAAKAIVREVLALTGWRPTELARQAGVVPSTINRFLHQPVRHTLSYKTLHRILGALGRFAAEHPDDKDIQAGYRRLSAALLPGEPSSAHRGSRPPPTVPVLGYVGAGARVYPIDDLPLGTGLEQVAAPEGVGDNPMVAVRIRGDSMLPMQDGWLLFYRRDQEGVPEDCLRRLCVVKIADDGPMMVKEVRRGYRRGRFTLFSWNATPLEDVRLEWAARVLAIRPS